MVWKEIYPEIHRPAVAFNYMTKFKGSVNRLSVSDSRGKIPFIRTVVSSFKLIRNFYSISDKYYG